MKETETETAGFRLSPQQAHVLASGGALGAVQCAVLLEGPIDPQRLREALDAVVARHEILRTTFVQPAGMRTRQQVIATSSAQAWGLQEEARSEGLTDGAALEELMRRERASDFDLERGPLLRVLLAGAGEPSALLLLTVSAACADATSALLLLGELCSAYAGGEALEEPVQYADYAEWRHELIADEESQMRDGLAFWREDAADRPPPPRVLFVLRGLPHEARSEAAALDLDGIGRDELQRAAVGAGVTIAVFLEAAWHALLARMSGVSELVLAGSVDGRAQPDLAGATGAYEQPAPVRSRFQENTTFAEILDQVRRSRAIAVRWQDCAGAEDLDSLSAQGAAGSAFHSVAALGAPARALLALRPAGDGTPLALVVRAGEQELTGELVYDPLLVEHEDAAELADRFATLVRSALDDPSAPVSRLAIMGAAERQLLLAEFVSEAVAGPATPVHEQFQRQAQRTPERLAVLAASGSLTYAELDAASNRLAGHLEQLGVLREPVGLCMERTPAMIVAVLAILKAGGAYLPLNHEHPSARIARQLADAQARVLLTEEHLMEALGEPEQTVICLDRDAAAIEAHGTESLGRLVRPDELAYVMFTSGSTGTPKGVAVTHGNLANYADSIVARLEIEDAAPGLGLVFGVISALSTDLGNTSIFTPLISGGCVRLLSSEASMDGRLLADELDGEQLDVLKVAPSHLRALLLAADAAVLPRRWLVVGGEALSWELVQEVRALSPSCSILNHYGPTETTVGCTTHLVEAQPRPDALTVPIGFPLAGARAYVLDSRLEPVPAGVPGELCIAGAGVAAGYIGADEHGPGGFTADPFAPAAHPGRMYRTGDRVRRLRDGAIEFLGRLDDQLKIRGFRVEPSEIEATLLEHAEVRQVAVCAEDDERGGLRLAAYVVAPEGPPVEELRAFLGERLPAHMIPSAFRNVEALPLTASGKIDRKRLSGLAEVQARREAEYIAPRDAVERQIAEIWGELLGVERVGALDDFFALGGHSLLATQATMRIRSLYGDIPLRALLAAPTVAALAEAVRATGAPSAVGGAGE